MQTPIKLLWIMICSVKVMFQMGVKVNYLLKIDDNINACVAYSRRIIISDLHRPSKDLFLVSYPSRDFSRETCQC